MVFGLLIDRINVSKKNKKKLASVLQLKSFETGKCTLPGGFK